MENIVVSLFVKKNIYAILLQKSGMLYSREVKHITDDYVNGSVFRQQLYVIDRALRIVRNYIENNSDCEEFIFELNNSVVIKWFDKFYSRPEYQDSFEQTFNLLQELPIKYLFVYNKRPMATTYAKEDYINDKVVINNDIDLNSEEQDDDLSIKLKPGRVNVKVGKMEF